VASHLRDHVRQLALQRVASAQPLVRVSLTPNQRVAVNWFVVCSKGFGSGSKSGSFKARTSVRRKVRMPTHNPHDCAVSASAQLDGGERRRVTLLPTDATVCGLCGPNQAAASGSSPVVAGAACGRRRERATLEGTQARNRRHVVDHYAGL
jgi:hypothetical protein